MSSKQRSNNMELICYAHSWCFCIKRMGRVFPSWRYVPWKKYNSFFIAAYRSIIDRVWNLCDIGSDPCMFYRKIIL